MASEQYIHYIDHFLVAAWTFLFGAYVISFLLFLLFDVFVVQNVELNLLLLIAFYIALFPILEQTHCALAM